MKIYATFANRKHAPEEYELLDAWDEWSIDNNSEGFESHRQKALDALGDELLEWRTIVICIEDASVEDAFATKHVIGTT